MHGTDVRLTWKERSRQLVTSCSLFDLYTSERISGRGKTAVFSILAAPDWVTIVPVLRVPGREDAFLMVRQYRHGAELITTEFPAGLAEPGEDPLHAAARELEEETGYRAGRMSPLGRVSPNPAFMNNWCSTFLAEDLAHVGGLSLDETEELDVLEIPVSTVRESIGTGELINALTMVALMLYERRHAAGDKRDAPR
jgi:8-oxo-dGTP pyrophosphatase MutT (NUDIX family)